MEKLFIRTLFSKASFQNNIFKRNTVKEYLQILILDYIYSHKKYSNLIFYGGSCLSHCFGLPRLSEDIDFIDIKKQTNIYKMASELQEYFKKNTDLSLTVLMQKFRIYLKFPILYELGLSKRNESNLLFLKIEIFNKFDFCNKYKIEIIPLFKFNKSMLIKTFDLSTLMSTKIRAILYRKWTKTDRKGKTLIKVKGRDYFDLMWYLEKGIKPNMNCIENIKSKDELKENLLNIIEYIDTRSIKLDLEAFIADGEFVKNLSKNIKNILQRNIKNI